MAKVTAAERVPKADKLLKLTLDVGGEPRTVVSGISPAYAPEEMVGRTVWYLPRGNLKPAKIRAVSQGMILAAGGAEVLALGALDRDVPPGTKSGSAASLAAHDDDRVGQHQRTREGDLGASRPAGGVRGQVEAGVPGCDGGTRGQRGLLAQSAASRHALVHGAAGAEHEMPHGGRGPRRWPSAAPIGVRCTLPFSLTPVRPCGLMSMTCASRSAVSSGRCQGRTKKKKRSPSTSSVIVRRVWSIAPRIRRASRRPSGGCSPGAAAAPVPAGRDRRCLA